MKKFREMKKNNKGFSLVELIVVIAIMVVLVAVLGSTILGYVDKSKHSKDMQALDALKTAVSSFVADPNCKYTNNSTYTLDALRATGVDPKGVINATLKEVFQTNDEDVYDFQNSSSVFDGVNGGTVYVCISDGAVSILAESSDPTNFSHYTAGDQSKINKNSAITATGNAENNQKQEQN